MKVAEIYFDNEREGIVPIGTILADAARRIGVDIGDCTHPTTHNCKVVIEKGAEYLSAPGKTELELLAGAGDERLACFVTIEDPGVIIAMSSKKSEQETHGNEPVDAEDRNDPYRKEFVEFPLEKKIAKLLQLEVITISETLAYVFNSPFTVFEKIGDVLAEFGLNKEAAEKEQKRAAAESKESKAPTKKRQITSGN